MTVSSSTSRSRSPMPASAAARRAARHHLERLHHLARVAGAVGDLSDSRRLADVRSGANTDRRRWPHVRRPRCGRIRRRRRAPRVGARRFDDASRADRLLRPSVLTLVEARRGGAGALRPSRVEARVTSRFTRSRRPPCTSAMSSQRQAELEQDLLGVLAELGGRAQRRRRLVELHRVGDQGEAAAVVAARSAQIAVGERLRIVVQLERRSASAPRRPRRRPAPRATRRACAGRRSRRAPATHSARF